MHFLLAIGLFGGIFYYVGVGPVVLVFAGSIVGFCVIIWAIGAPERKRQQESAARLRELLALHQDALARQRISLVRKDAYGTEVPGPWQKEMQKFAERVLAPVTGERYYPRHAVFGSIDSVAKARSEQILAQFRFDERMSPREYEIFCAEVLRKYGWEASATQQSADQGADVIAMKDGKRGVLQCKLFSKPVGNKAVQEAHAARSHYVADFAAVVSNAGFTSSARQLAATTGVLLISHYDLPELKPVTGIP